MPNTKDYIGVVISDVGPPLPEFRSPPCALGITRGQWLVLTRLHRSPGASHSELAEMMEVEKATAGRMIDRLVANGWVETPRPKIRRPAREACLYNTRSRTGTRMWRIAEDTVESALADLSAGRQAALRIAAARQGDAGFRRQRFNKGSAVVTGRIRRAGMRTNSGLRRDAAPTKTRADWRARARHRRRARRLRLQGGRHVTTETPTSRLISPRSPVIGRIIEVRIRTSRRMNCWSVSIPPLPACAGQGRGQHRSARAAVEQLKASLREIRLKPKRPRTS